MDTVIDFLASNAQFFALLVGLLTPAVTALVEQPSLPPVARKGVAVAVSVTVGFVVAASTGQLGDGLSLFSIVAIVLVSAEASYQKLIHGPVKAIEAATSVGTGPAA